MSSSRPGPRPSMHASIPMKWLKCDDHIKVTKWYMSVTNIRRYPLFYSSFVNAANQAWVKSTDPRAKKLTPMEVAIVDCLLMEPIPAETLIEVLESYNKLIGGTKGDLKSTGLIKWDDEHPKESAIEKGVEDLYNLIAKTRHLCSRASANMKVNASTSTSISTSTKQVTENEDEDEEMEDFDVEGEKSLLSLNDMSTELTSVSNAPAIASYTGKGKKPVKFEDLPLRGRKDDDEDME